MLKDYPISVIVNDLKLIYGIDDKLIDSPYNFYSLSRGYKIDKNCIESRRAEDKYQQEILKRHNQLSSSEIYLEAYVDNLFQTIRNEGLRFFNECNFDLCYKAVLNPLKESRMKQYSMYYQEYLDSFNDYCREKSITPPDLSSTAKIGWFLKWFSSN